MYHGVGGSSLHTEAQTVKDIRPLLFRESPSLGSGCEAQGAPTEQLSPLGPRLHTATPAGPDRTT